MAAGERSGAPSKTQRVRTQTWPDLQLGILNGDDVGHEVVPAAVEVAQAAADRTGLKIDWVPLPIGRKAFDELGYTMPPGTLEKLGELDGWILGPIGHRDYPKHPQAINPHPILRKSFDLFANVRPTRSYPDIGCLYDGVDLVIVRENNEGFQPDRNVVAGSGEFRPTEDVTISVRVITRAGSYKVADAALQLAQARRKKLTVVHKNTVFKLGCGMFVEECYRAAEKYPDVEVEEVIVDTFAMHLAAQSAPLRHGRHHQYVRRHPQRRGGRSCRRPRHGAGPLHRPRRYRHGAGDPWFGAGHRW